MRPLSIFVAAALSAPGLASDLNLSITSGGSASVAVAPGASVVYDVTGELSDAANEGLALFAFDLSFDGGDLAQASTPASDPMQRFAPPQGLSNPAGFGGTVVSGDLVQVGGGQNTIQNSFAPQPTGVVLTGVAQPGSPETLASGVLTAPAAPGTYTLSLSNVVANVIRQGETGSPFWAVDPACADAVGSLEVVVLDCGTFNYCISTANSDFPGGGMITSQGSTSIAANDFVLRAEDVKKSGFGLFFYGDSQLQTPFGDGFRCVGGQTHRVQPPVQADPTGFVSKPVSFTTGPASSGPGLIDADSTWNFQLWYRDPMGPGGTGYNLSDGLSVTFCE